MFVIAMTAWIICSYPTYFLFQRIGNNTWLKSTCIIVVGIVFSLIFGIPIIALSDGMLSRGSHSIGLVVGAVIFGPFAGYYFAKNKKVK
jgi:hypothetical protein